MTADHPLWRPMTVADLAPVMAVADVVHPAYFEPVEVFAERLDLFADGCQVLALPEGRIVGYGVAHPAKAGIPPPLAALLGGLPADADVLHLHDVAILPPWRGRGLPAGCLAALTAAARRAGLARLALVAVNGAQPFWQRFGFAPAPVDPLRLASYGAGACYMMADTNNT